MGRLSELRLGTITSSKIEVMGETMAIVILPADTIREIEELSEQYVQGIEGIESQSNMNIKNMFYDRLLVYHCLRDSNKLDVKIADSPDEVGESLDIDDIRRIAERYGEMMLNKSDATSLELLDEEQLDNIKKFLETTQLKDLNTVSLVHLANFHQAIALED